MLSFYPKELSSFSDLDILIKKHLLSQYSKTQVLSGNKPVMTQGSCFAANFAKGLASVNYPVAHLFVNEYINSTLANAIFFQTIKPEPYSSITEHRTFENQVRTLLAVQFGPSEKEDFRNTLKVCSAFILTVGVAPVWVEKHTKHIHLAPDKRAMNQFQMVTTGVDHNARNILSIAHAVRSINPEIKIFITLSPAPLNASDEYNSIFEADCISKSTLRLAIDKALKTDPQLIYWPSFEVVRWMGSHLPPVYGDDDGEPRHVSNWVVDKIITNFVEYNGGDFHNKISTTPHSFETKPFSLGRNFSL